MASVFQPCKSDKNNRFYPCDKTRCGHKWTVRYREPGGAAGSQREKSFTLKRDADDFATKVENDKRVGVYLDPERGKMTVKAWCADFLTHHVMAPSTYANYEKLFRLHLVPELGRKTLAGVGPEDIKRLQSKMHAAGFKATTVNEWLLMVAGLFAEAVRVKRIGENPCAGLEPLKTAGKSVDPDEIPTVEQVAAIADAISPLYRLAVLTMSGAGMRPSEALAFGPDERRDGFIRLRRQLSSYSSTEDRKTRLRPLKHRAEGEYRDIPLAPFLAELCDWHMTEFGAVAVDGVELYFSQRTFAYSEAGLPHMTTFRAHWIRAMKSVGLMLPDGQRPKYTPHDLRHFYASTALTHGVPIHEVSQWLGHKSINVTVDVYGHLMPGATDRLRQVMDDALRPALGPVS